MSPPRPTVAVIGHRLDPAHYRIRDFVIPSAQPYEWHEAGSEDARELLRQHGLDESALPVVIDGAEAIASATAADLARAWEVRTRPARTDYDVAIVGAGPAGLAAAV